VNPRNFLMPRRYETYTSMQGEVEDWLLGDTLFNPHIGGRIMLFGRGSARDWIGDVDKIYVDGTFSVTPHPWNMVRYAGTSNFLRYSL